MMKAIFHASCCLAILLMSAVGAAEDQIDMPLLGMQFAAGAEDDVQGVPVQAAAENGPAGSAGVAAGDVLLSISGHPVDAYAEIAPFLRDKRPGSEVALRIRRGEEIVELNVTLGSMRAAGFPPEEIWMAYWLREDLSEAELVEVAALRKEYRRLMLDPAMRGHRNHRREMLAIRRDIYAFQEEERILEEAIDDFNFELDTLNSEGKGLDTEQAKEWTKRHAKLMERDAPLEERKQDYRVRKRDHDIRLRTWLDKSPQMNPPYDDWRVTYNDMRARYKAFSDKMSARSTGDQVK